ncbi:hypothetical protein [Caenimonas koreensis]|uniref:Lipoprotein n=1 Tax=Caenimonas koreensis DSM 17982 TaxID=1121255 RepID=A0A844B7A8_9BURK|nr:hypothetical protein [Caenimonas koreensis]MRD47539.1 hypothetical protein [Caenimonas koreensis DSM 17982]
MRIIFLLTLCALLQSCGGGDGTAVSPQTPLAKTEAAEARARSLLQTSACTSDAQCGYVTFQTPFHSCSQGEHAALLLVSRNAPAAAEAAQEQRFWAAEAKKLLPPPNFACAAYVEPLPVPSCVQAQCTLKSGWVVLEALAP